jgi:hypothetical protein
MELKAMSLSDTAQIYELLMQIDAVLNGINVKTEKVERQAPQLRENLATFRQLEQIALRYLIISRRMGLPENVQQATEQLTALIIIARQAQMTINLLMLGTPAGYLLGAAGLILTIFSASDFTMSIGE